MTSQVNIEFWKEFIKLYKSHPVIWNKKRSDLYTNRFCKKNAYQKLLQKLREEFPNATLDTLKRKINTLRGCYRRELKKVLHSEKCGFNVYVPTLWYFEHLSFLRCQEIKDVEPERQDNSSSFAHDDEFEWEETKAVIEKVEDDETILAMDENTIMTLDADDNAALEDHNLIIDNNDNDDELNSPSLKKTRRDSAAPLSVVQSSPIKRSRSSSNRTHEVTKESSVADDDARTLSAAWGVLFRKLTSEQQLYANKTIMGVLYQGALGNLNEFSYKLLENSHSNEEEFQFQGC